MPWCSVLDLAAATFLATRLGIKLPFSLFFFQVIANNSCSDLRLNFLFLCFSFKWLPAAIVEVLISSSLALDLTDAGSLTLLSVCTIDVILSKFFCLKHACLIKLL